MCNTLFGKIDSVANIKYDDMMEYLDLIVAMYELSPEGCFTANIRKKLRIIFCIEPYVAIYVLTFLS